MVGGAGDALSCDAGLDSVVTRRRGGTFTGGADAAMEGFGDVHDDPHGGARAWGCRPRLKRSMRRIGPPQQGHGLARRAAGSAAAFGAGGVVLGGAAAAGLAPSSARMVATQQRRAALARKP